MDDLKGKWALVTGASSGLGVSFARQLAARGASLVLTARRAERLEKLAEELRGGETRVEVIPADLAAPDGAERLHREVAVRGIEVEVLINNAGAGLSRPFLDLTWEGARSQLVLNAASLLELTHRFASAMRERGHGYVLNVSSIGAYLPVPRFAVYAPAKALVRNFSEALAHELRRTGVRVCCLCPGGIDTEFMDVSQQKVTGMMRLALMKPDRCARIGLRALFGGRRNIVSGFSNALGMWLLRFVPRRIMVAIAAVVMGGTADPGAAADAPAR